MMAHSSSTLTLRVRMLVYAHINLVTMLVKFDVAEAIRVDTDSIYIQKTGLYRLEGVEAYVAPRLCK